MSGFESLLSGVAETVILAAAAALDEQEKLLERIRLAAAAMIVARLEGGHPTLTQWNELISAHDAIVNARIEAKRL